MLRKRKLDSYNSLLATQGLQSTVCKALTLQSTAGTAVTVRGTAVN
jgi:hypothetical protein